MSLKHVDIVCTLKYLAPGQIYVLHGEDWDNAMWPKENEIKKPSMDELVKAHEAISSFGIEPTQEEKIDAIIDGGGNVSFNRLSGNASMIAMEVEV